MIGIAADHPLAVKAGKEILEEGGNIFDATIAISSVLSVVQPQMGGLGGDAFILILLNNGEVLIYNGSGRSLKNFDVDEYLKEKPIRGPLTFTVPGLVDLWGFLQDNFCSMDLKRILKSSISIAFNGFNIGLLLAEHIKECEADLYKFDNWRKMYLGKKFGDLFKNPSLGLILSRIGEKGWEEFYRGELAIDMVNELNKQGVKIELKDLEEHKGFKVKPIKYEIQDKILYEIPPNSQGISTLQMISALYELKLDKYEFFDKSRIKAWAEPVRKIYNFRDKHIGDPEFVKINVSEYLSYGSLNYTSLKAEVSGEGDTTFFTLVDSKGNLIGFIQSLFYPFGSGLIAHGISFQNRGSAFAKIKNLPNSPSPNKRPLHTLSILAVEDKEFKGIIGCAGGDLRPQIHTRIFENIFVYKMSLEEAIKASRFLFLKDSIIFEDSLKRSAGLVNASLYKDKSIIVATDPRGEGNTIIFQ